MTLTPQPSRFNEEITLRRLEVLLVFIETGNLARTAERLETSAVSVHRALHGLEEGTRCALFRHEGRNLLPTDAAHVLADVARDLLMRLERGIGETRQAAGFGADTIRIGSLYSLTSRAVPAIFFGLRQRLPSLNTELVLGSNADLVQKLHQGAIDAAVMGIPESTLGIEHEPLFEDDIFFAAPVDSVYATMESVDLGACQDVNFVSLSDGFVTQNAFVEAFKVADFSPKVVMKTGDIFSLMNLVGGGVGCTLLPGRIRSVLPHEVRLIPLQRKYLVRQSIALTFLKSRERDPNLLALLAVCRTVKGAMQ
ncbi:MAG: LysR family transcriptional regulator [Hydrogenophaga sp.]|uniref:LysR family transcriptional regulator n=1 Tax=Hydrogenophaga sp. TaxID=1904254 RepID=UPI0025BAAB10|nr:LysR family transcriptional regulator [Hydrogenophaga sp.]MBT9549720.1 LysR family transcriptional regulator [Hydrogenophaga sp.]